MSKIYQNSIFYKPRLLTKYQLKSTFSLKIAKLRSKTKLITLKNVSVQSSHFLISRSVKYTWARGHVEHVEHVEHIGTWARRVCRARGHVEHAI